MKRISLDKVVVRSRSARNSLFSRFSPLLFVLSLFLVFVVSCATANNASDLATKEIVVHSDGSKLFRGATLDRSGPIPVLELKGTSYEQGFAYGVLMKEDLSVAYNKLERVADNMLNSFPWYKRIFAKRIFAKRCREFEELTPKRYREEMRGLADGSGCDYETILLAAVYGTGNGGCTSVLAATPDNVGVLHGRNYDFSPFFAGDFPVIVRHEYDNSIPYWNISVIGYLPSFNGFNDAGISASLNGANARSTTPNGLPSGWKMREILLGAKSLDDVRRIVKSTKNGNANRVMTVGSATQSSGIVFDLVNDIQAEEKMSESKPMVVLNRAFGDGRHIDDGLAGKYMDVLVSNSNHNRSRWLAAERYISNNGIDSEEEMWGFLRDRSGAAPDFFFSDGTIANESTLFSVVFDLAANKISLSTASSWASMRQVWRFDIPSRKFSPLLSPDSFVETAEFQSLERKYLELEEAAVSGTLTMEMVTGDLDPFMIDRYGFRFHDPEHPDSRLIELYEKAALSYPDLFEFHFWTGYLIKDKNTQKAIAYFETALNLPGITPVGELHILDLLANAYLKIGDKKSAAKSASRWNHAAKVLCNGYTVPEYIQNNQKKMEKIASEI